MGASYLVISAASTILSFVGLQFWTEFSLDKLRTDGLVVENVIHLESANRVLELLLRSYATVALLANFVLNVFVLINLCLKTIFFGELYPAETRKFVERLINYVIYKFYPFGRSISEGHKDFEIMTNGCRDGMVELKIRYMRGDIGDISASGYSTNSISSRPVMFQALARDRLERLNASPSATPWTYFRVFSALLFVLAVDIFWIRMCLLLFKTLDSSMFLLLFFEPLSVAFETMQLLDIWLHHSAGNSTNCARSKFFDTLAAGSLLEWKGILIRNFGFFLDMATLLMALGHYIHIWWLRGMAFHLVDAILFLNIRVNICALLSAIIKRIKGFIKLRIALGHLHAALPDATSEELRAYDDECAICREPMAKAKKLLCNHLFHLACLRSWLDQGLNEMYSCPTCRKPLFVGRREIEANSRPGEVSSDEQLARQLSMGLDRQNNTGQTLPTGVFPNQTQPPVEGSPWRLSSYISMNAGLDSSWLHAWPSQGVDGAGPSTAMRSVGLSRVQMMMRHLASVGETYAQTAIEDTSWSLWPMNPSQASASGSPVPPAVPGRHPGNTGGAHARSTSRSANDNIANILAMAETVREVLPHIPEDLIFQKAKVQGWAHRTRQGTVQRMRAFERTNLKTPMFQLDVRRTFVSPIARHLGVINNESAAKRLHFCGKSSLIEMKHAGSEKFESSSHVGLLEATRFLEGSRRRAIGTNNNKAEEDVAAATDYEPPHQTPPIHNSKP
ncbi:E3 ubiquitin protein ligase RIN2 [Citrus sinensis]|uniref:E3 ubiquitin protein ligase RIN2 n=1 Tax=Citrus sinensis TaxID=2711 RepID=A0ACB8HUF6_CITSI|nr:E3 ubiquitin protein ligase RIN2 [Citrus sinensis]